MLKLKKKKKGWLISLIYDLDNTSE